MLYSQMRHVDGTLLELHGPAGPEMDNWVSVLKIATASREKSSAEKFVSTVNQTTMLSKWKRRSIQAADRKKGFVHNT